MVTLSTEQIKEIAGQLDCGFTCFLNRHNKEIISLRGDEDDFSGFDDEDAWAEDRKKIDDNPGDYYEFEKMGSGDSFSVMEDFINTVDSVKVRKDLIYALNQKKPFRQFKYVIDNSGEYREKWFDFKDKKMIEWVVAALAMINGKEEEDL
jgi:hypothetical protein